MSRVESAIASRVLGSRLVSSEQLTQCLSSVDDPADDQKLLKALVKRGLLTSWQAAVLQTGRTEGFFLQHYKLLEPLGAGGMGQVFRAIDLKSSWHVAVKVLPRRSATPDAVRRFQREGQAAFRVQHENIVRTLDLGQQGKTYFLVMEIVVGTDLAKHITDSGKLSVGETARIGHEIALALECARLNGIIHRDVKPSNILLTLQGQAKLADLGLAKFFGITDERSTELTHSGAVMGTIDYMAPEQAEDAKRADTRSDIYSLGCTLYKCLTGRTPFPDGTTVQKILAHRTEDPEPITLWNSDVPEPFATIIRDKMLAKSRADRFQTPAEVAAALAPWATQQSGERTLALAATLAKQEPDTESREAVHSTHTDANEPDAAPQYITVVCATCGTRLAMKPSQAGTKIECPDCGKGIPVPWPKKVVVAPVPKPNEVSAYQLQALETRKPVVVAERSSGLTLPPDVESDDEETESSSWRPSILLGAGILALVVIIAGTFMLSHWIGSRKNSTTEQPQQTELLGDSFVSMDFGLHMRLPKTVTKVPAPAGVLGMYQGGNPPLEVVIIGSAGTESLQEFESVAIQILSAAQKGPGNSVQKLPDGLVVNCVYGGQTRFDLFSVQLQRPVNGEASSGVLYDWLICFAEEQSQKIMVAFLVPDSQYEESWKAVAKSLETLAMGSRFSTATAAMSR